MEQLITHACGHEQAHSLTGFASQQERKARWLRTTTCRTCFIAEKRSEQADAAAQDSAAVAHLDLPTLTGSERQIAWASTIRAKRLATVVASSAVGAESDHRAYFLATDAKWWIDNRDLPDTDLLAKAARWAAVPADSPPTVRIVQAA